MAEVSWSDDAESELEQIAFYIGVEKQNPQAADRLLDDFAERSQAYARQPGMGTLHEEMDIPGIGGPIRSFRVKSYVAFYQEIDDGILVLRVVDGRRELGGLFG